jgi:hypothetical protein
VASWWSYAGGNKTDVEPKRAEVDVDLPELNIIASRNQVTALTFQTKKPSKPINARAIGSPTPRPTPRPILKDPEFAEGVVDVVAGWDDVLPNDD